MSKFSRRGFLKSSSILGGSLALSGAFPGVVRAADADNRKLIVVSIGHSLDPLDAVRGAAGWFPTTNSDGTIQSFQEHLKPLEEFKEKMVVVSGCENLVSRMVRSNGHNASSRTLLNCLPHKGWRDYGDTLDMASGGGGPSIEHFLGDRLNSIPLVLRNNWNGREHRRSFLMDGTGDNGNPDPVKAFDTLFANAMTNEGLSTTAEKLRARRGQILNTVRDSYDQMSLRAGVDDRERLQSHASLLEYFIRETDQAGSGVVSSCSNIAQNVPSGYSPDFDQSGSGRDDHIMTPLHNSLLATALACGSTRVASLHYSNMHGNQFPFLNGGNDLITETGGNWHAVCHHEVGSDALRTRCFLWWTEMWVDLLRKLDNTPDTNGSVLDNTIVVFTSNLGDRTHSTKNIPFFVVGGANTGLKTNQALDVTSGDHTTADMWTTILQLMGQPDETFGVTGNFRSTGSYNGRPFNQGPFSDMMI